MTTDYERGVRAAAAQFYSHPDTSYGSEFVVRTILALLPPASSSAGGDWNTTIQNMLGLDKAPGPAEPECKHARIAGGSDCQYCLDCGQEFQPAWRRVGPHGETDLPPMPGTAAEPRGCPTPEAATERQAFWTADEVIEAARHAWAAELSDDQEPTTFQEGYEAGMLAAAEVVRTQAKTMLKYRTDQAKALAALSRPADGAAE